MYSKGNLTYPSQRYQTHQDSSILCSNCSCLGHTSKNCPQPITSYGVIVFTVKGEWNQGDNLLQTERGSAITGLEQQTDHVLFLLIQRRDSIGFVEIMRGKYKTHDTDYILQHLNGMTQAEREALIYTPFDELWEGLWGKPMHGGSAYKHEKDQAKQKLEALRNGTPSLQQLINVAGPAWSTPEWGFPKGRRDSRESEYMCAMRELWEETNLKEGEIVPIRGLEPITECFFGSNNVQYSHKYYIAYAPPVTAAAVDYNTAAEESEHVRREVGNIGWFTLEEALRLIRPENVEKKEILLRVCNLLRNYCPLRLPA